MQTELRKFRDEKYARTALSFYHITASSSEFGHQILLPQQFCPCWCVFHDLPTTPCSHRQGLQDNESSFPCRNVLAMTKPYFSQRGNISVCASMQDFSITGKHFLRRQVSWRANKTACVMLFLAFGNHGELLAQSACTAGFQAQVTCFCVPDP